MKYNVGDKVIVRNDLNQNTQYFMDDKCDYWYCCDEMIARGGQVVTIEQADQYKYTIAEDDGCFHWSDEMFSGLYFDPVAITPVNDYTAACFYCQQGGIVDRMAQVNRVNIVCPVCGRICYGG